MRNVKLKFVGINSNFRPVIKVDGQIIKAKKNEFGSYETDYNTDNDNVEISIERNLELNAKLWWLYVIISFIISIFGLFEPPYDKRCIVIDCKFNVKLNDTNEIKLKFNTMNSQGKAVEIETQNQVDEIKNEYYVDKKAKTKRNIITLIKILIWIVLIIGIIFFISEKI